MFTGLIMHMPVFVLEKQVDSRLSTKNSYIDFLTLKKTKDLSVSSRCQNTPKMTRSLSNTTLWLLFHQFCLKIWQNFKKLSFSSGVDQNIGDVTAHVAKVT